MEIEFHPEAEDEFVEGAAYYEARVQLLGTSFIAELESAIALLRRHPKLGAEIERPFRRLLMRKFPHSIIYAVEDSRIWIVAVAHQKRQPGYWRSRIGR